MRLFKAIRFNRMACNLRFESAETQPLIGSTEICDKKFNQYFVALIANIIGMSWGTAIGWSSPCIEKMSGDLSYSPLDFVPTPDQFSWIGSILPLGGIFSLVFAPFPGLIGRKWSLVINALFFLGSYCILIFTHDINSIYIARFLQGFGSGVVMVLLPMYTGEISSADCRGVLSSFIQIGLVVGILYAYCIGPVVDYVMFQWCCLVIPAIFMVLFAFICPESPHFFIARGEREKAFKSLGFLRGKSCEDVKGELEEIQASVNESMKHSSSVLDIFRSRANRLAMKISVGLICFQNFSGIDAVLFYSGTIFENASSSLDSSIATILMGTFMLISSCISPFFVDHSGRKGLLLISAMGMAISLTTMGIYFFFDEREMTGAFGWLPVTSLVFFILFYCLGFGPLPFTILSEMFAPEIKSAASSIAVSTCWIVDFGVTKSFLPLESIVGHYGNFWIFGGFCVIAFGFVARQVFETKGLTLNEIQDKLNRRKPLAPLI